MQIGKDDHKLKKSIGMAKCVNTNWVSKFLHNACSFVTLALCGRFDFWSNRSVGIPASVGAYGVFNWGPFYKHELTLISGGINNYIHYKVWDEVKYPFQNLYGCTVDMYGVFNWGPFY